MGFNVSNGFRPAAGIGGTARAASATFNQDPGQAAQGMGQGMQPAAPTQGSSYTLGNGMGGTSRYAGITVNGGPTKAAQSIGAKFGSDPNYQVSPWAGADIGQNAPKMSIEDMQDPANAAMAGFGWAATQDQAPSASTNGPGRPQPQQPIPPPPASGPSLAGPQITGPVSANAANAVATMQQKQPLSIPRVPVLQR